MIQWVRLTASVLSSPRREPETDLLSNQGSPEPFEEQLAVRAK